MKEKNISIPCKQLLQSMLEKEQKYRPSWDELITDIKAIIKKGRLTKRSRFRNYRRRVLSMLQRKKYLNYTHELIALSHQDPEKVPSELQVRIKKLRYARIFLWSSIVFALITIVVLLIMIGNSGWMILINWSVSQELPILPGQNHYQRRIQQFYMHFQNLMS